MTELSPGTSSPDVVSEKRVSAGWALADQQRTLLVDEPLTVAQCARGEVILGPKANGGQPGSGLIECAGERGLHVFEDISLFRRKVLLRHGLILLLIGNADVTGPSGSECEVAHTDGSALSGRYGR
jgi:hypothetical protein